MPIIVFYRNGQSEAFQSRDKRGLLDYRQIELTTLGGHETSVFKEDVRRVEYFPDAEWAKMIEKQEKEQEKREAEKMRQQDDQASAAAAAKRGKIRKLFDRNKAKSGKTQKNHEAQSPAQ